ncbi:ATP-binding protein [Bacillus sp. FJAT-22090]|uniref:hybrid sensor histidine kinase/response regulator n=1 Tax=Bacillus sp. FJAT-22090 TaxID=1581038 RepID=UPI00119E8C11|nr:ATP-binding protein [Bacillus sp. FJAT-22090]
MVKRKVFIFLSISIFLLTLLYIIKPFQTDTSSPFPIQNGILSLEDWDEEDQIIELNGDWDFFPDTLIVPSPNYDVFAISQENRKQITVPGEWNDRLKESGPHGVGTYRLIVKVPKEGRYGIKAASIRNSSKIYINGKEVGGVGNPTERIEDFKYDNRKYTVYGESENRQLEIVVLVANLTYYTGGITHPLKFGTAQNIIAKHEMDRLIKMMIITGFLLMGIIHFFTFIQRKKYLYELFFALFCITLGVYTSMLNEYLFFLVFPGFDAKEQTRLQLLVIHLVVLFFLLFVYHLFKQYAKKKIVIVLSSLLCIQIVIYGTKNPVILLVRHLSLTTRQILIVFFLAICFVYILVVLMRAFLRKKEDTEYLLLTMTTFMCYGLLLGLEFLFELQVKSILSALSLLMIFSLSLLMGHRYQAAFNRVEGLSEELLLYDRLKDEFLVKTSHELSTPLHGIINLSKLLMEGIDGPLKRKQQENIILIHNVGKRLASLVEDLLFVSTIKKGETRLAARPVNISIVEEVLAEMNYLISPMQQLKLVNNMPKNLPPIYMDEQKLKQVFFNLIYNAIKYTAAGSITIEAEVRETQMYISVSDTGKGIEKEHLELIFSSFYQIESSRSGDSTGLGLGLSITKNIIESSGGRIWAASKIGQGSRFTFTAPLATTQQLGEVIEPQNIAEIFQRTNEVGLLQSATSVSTEKEKAIKPYTVLVVDNEPANLQVLINMIHSLNYHVIAASSGSEAMAILKKETIDLVIIDLMMPNMSGYELCQAVRKEYDLVELPVIILTAAGQLSDLVASFQVGANDFLQKPVNLDELKARVESLLLMKKSAEDAIKDELSFFYAQITPHFLYNTLNTIIGLSYNDVEKTREALQHLAIYFRAKLDAREHHALVELEDEVELVQAYLAIEQIRFGDRLTIEYAIDETIETYIPSMTIQPLVENAVQHGISKQKHGGTLLLAIERESSNIKITIEDNGVGIPLEKQQELLEGKNNRIGFTNPLKKLTLIKGATFQLDSEEGKGTKITIRLPEVKNNESIIG